MTIGETVEFARLKDNVAALNHQIDALVGEVRRNQGRIDDLEVTVVRLVEQANGERPETPTKKGRAA